MKRKEANQFTAQTVADALDAAFNHGMAMQRLSDAQRYADQTSGVLQQRVEAANEILHIPSKKEMH